MNTKPKMYLGMSLLCFALVLELHQKYLVLLSVPGNTSMSQVASFLVALGLYTFIFQLLLSLSLAANRRWLSDEARLVGEWHQVFVIHNYSDSQELSDSIRHGLVRIVLSETGLEITAENRKATGNEAPSGWHSDKVSIQGSQVWLLFSSTGPGRGSTHGNMLFHNQSGKKLSWKSWRMTGQFSDSSPATHFGSIELFRDKSEFDDRLRALMPAA